MKCPLLRIPIANVKGGERNKADECIQEECAWFDYSMQQCCILSFQQNVEDLAHWLKDIRDKMPHEGQFRK